MIDSKDFIKFYALTLPEIDIIERATHEYIEDKDTKTKILRQTQALRSVISKVNINAL